MWTLERYFLPSLPACLLDVYLYTEHCLFTIKKSPHTKLQLQAARVRLNKLFDETHCEPIIIRLAWHDAGSFSVAASKEYGWPRAGGATASIRFNPELGYGANVGLDIALKLLGPIKEEFPDLSWADLIQLASVQAIEHAGGPHIPLRLGRLAASSPEECAPDGRLPSGAPPFPDKAANPAGHLRHVFTGQYGLNDQDIVVLSGAHTMGRSRPGRSGFGKESTKYTEKGPGTPGGTSWTPDWLQFNNNYFKEVKAQRDEDLLVLPTDACLFEDDGFKGYAEKYAVDQDAFFTDYVKSHLKLSELGVKWAEGTPV